MFVMNTKELQENVVVAIEVIQKRWRAKKPRGTYLKMRLSAKFIQKFYRRITILRVYREVYLDVLKIVNIVQKVFRGHMGRKQAARRYRAVVSIQRAARGRLVRAR